MAAISVPPHEPWVVARWAFRCLLDRTVRVVSDDDKDVLERAKALDGLHFDLLHKEEARRISGAMMTAADELQQELSDTDLTDPRDEEFAEALLVLRVLLRDVGF